MVRDPRSQIFCLCLSSPPVADESGSDSEKTESASVVDELESDPMYDRVSNPKSVFDSTADIFSGVMRSWSARLVPLEGMCETDPIFMVEQLSTFNDAALKWPWPWQSLSRTEPIIRG